MRVSCFSSEREREREKRERLGFGASEERDGGGGFEGIERSVMARKNMGLIETRIKHFFLDFFFLKSRDRYALLNFVESQLKRC